MLGGIKYVFLGLAKVLGKTKLWLPKGFTPIFLIFQLVTEGLKLGWGVALSNLGTRLLSAEYVIRQNVNVAVNTPELYNLVNFFEIINSFLIIYFFIKFFIWLFDRMFSANKNFASPIIAVVIFIVVEYIWILTIGAFTVGNYVAADIDTTVQYIKPAFYPFKDGVLYLILNYKSVFTWNLIKFW